MFKYDYEDWLNGKLKDVQLDEAAKKGEISLIDYDMIVSYDDDFEDIQHESYTFEDWVEGRIEIEKDVMNIKKTFRITLARNSK